MNPPDWKQALTDLQEQCQLLVDDTRTISRHEFSENRILQRAVERYLATIGEAGTVIRDGNPEIYDELSDLRYVIGLRNRLSHGYGMSTSDNFI